MPRSAVPFVLALIFSLPAAPLPGGVFTPDATQPVTTYPILEPGACRGCHGDYDPAENLEPWNTWAGSLMANAMRDPLYWAAVDVANHDVPGIGDFCLRCHAPTPWLAGRSAPPGGSVDGCALLGELDQPDNDFAGLSCHFCHRMMVNPSPPPGEEPVYFENAKYWIDDEPCTGPGSEPCRRGPYDYHGSGDVPPPHVREFSPYHQGSGYCGNCHNVTSPALTLIDETGADTGVPYPIERTFREWQQSDFAVAGDGFESCQSCHMPDAQVDPAYACLQADNNRTGDLPMHELAGGNAWIPEVLRGDYPALGRDAELAASAALARDLLQNRSATVELAAASAEAGRDLAVEVRVTNLTGHKLPTGYPEGRRMWIHVAARDGGDDLIWESGAYDPATGELFEDEQIKIYRIEPGIWNHNGTGECNAADAGGSPIFHFVLNDCFAIDNRIPPLGFTGMNDLETRPVGYAYPETSPGSGVLVNYDTTAYAIPLPMAVEMPITVEATLYYQTASGAYVEFLRDQAVTHGFPDDCTPRTDGLPGMSRGELFFDMWTRYDRSPPVVMGAVSVEIELALFADGFESGDTSGWTLAVP